jgi:DnaJ-class molecular chaperone
VGAAVAILTDAAKRQRYDAGWSAEEIEAGFQEGAGGGMRGHGGGDHMDDLLAAMFGAGGPPGMRASAGFGGGFPGGGGGGFGGHPGYGGFHGGASFGRR